MKTAIAGLRIANTGAATTGGSRAQSYIDAATPADSKVQVMYSAVGSMTDIITQLRWQLSAASTGSATELTSAISSAKQMLSEMASLLNTQYDGRYVFSGSKTGTAPVHLSSYSSATGSTTTADTSYYAGDGEIASVRVGTDRSIAYDVTADNTAFEQAMRVLRYVANASSLSSSDISSALDLAGTALDATAAVQEKLSNAASSIEQASTRQSDYKSFAETLSRDLTSVDVAAVTAQLSTYQSQLTASYSAIGKIQSVPPCWKDHFSRNARAIWSRIGRVRYEITVRSPVRMNASTGMPATTLTGPSLGEFGVRHGDAGGVEAAAGLRVLADVGRDQRDLSLDLGRGALVEGGELRPREVGRIEAYAVDTADNENPGSRLLLEVLNVNFLADGQIIA